MVQGKFKKTKLPASIQKKQKQKNSTAFTRRSNAPIQTKKTKFTEHQKIKQAISKAVNKSAENELRSRAKEGNLNLSQAQKEVAKHHQSMNAANNANTDGPSGSNGKA